MKLIYKEEDQYLRIVWERNLYTLRKSHKRKRLLVRFLVKVWRYQRLTERAEKNLEENLKKQGYIIKKVHEGDRIDIRAFRRI